MKVNLNTNCSVVLTNLGASILNTKNIEYNTHLGCNHLKVNYRSNDVYKANLWHIMSTFGEHCHLGADAPIKDIFIGEEPPSSQIRLKLNPKKA